MCTSLSHYSNLKESLESKEKEKKANYLWGFNFGVGSLRGCTKARLVTQLSSEKTFYFTCTLKINEMLETDQPSRIITLSVN